MNKLQNIYAPLRRLQDFPLDSSSVFENLADAQRYAETNKSAYKGQVISIVNDGKNNGLYYLELEDNRLRITRAATQESLEDTIDSLDSLQTLVDSHDERIEALEGSVESNLEALTARINEIINNEATEAIDSIREITSWINEHKEEFALLKELSTNFATKEYVDNAVNKAKGEKLVLYELTGEIDNDIEPAIEEDTKITEIKVSILNGSSSLSEFVISDSDNYEYLTLDDIITDTDAINVITLHHSISAGTTLHVKCSGDMGFSAKIAVKLL